eukprot:2468774-Prymnesium_polylepis.1
MCVTSRSQQRVGTGRRGGYLPIEWIESMIDGELGLRLTVRARRSALDSSRGTQTGFHRSEALLLPAASGSSEQDTVRRRVPGED